MDLCAENKNHSMTNPISRNDSFLTDHREAEKDIVGFGIDLFCLARMRR